MYVLQSDVQMINKQPGMHKTSFGNRCCHYQEIYGLILINIFYSNTAVYGGKMSMVNLVTCPFFHSFEALIVAFEVQFSGLHVYTLSKTLIACRAMQLRYLKWPETLLNRMPLITAPFDENSMSICCGHIFT